MIQQNDKDMRHFDVYFEIYGKKMKTTILAEDTFDAQNKVRQKIKFNKIEKSKDEFNEAVDFLDLISGGLKK